jgi:hypothetical protein
MEQFLNWHHHHAVPSDHKKPVTYMITVETMPKGVVVVQRSTDRETVAALQQHASEVSELVQGGMAAMHAAMMKQSAIPPQAHDQTGPGQGHDQHHADVNKRGDEVMGFDHRRPRITTSNPEARSAIHEFLRFQISDHATGDSGKVEKP